ncbi:hypothetical protein AA0112_g2450 [Alternaria arborescens]|nr:hypothetical protein AA0112_g2450 [Alternaria arborescens]
MHWRHIKWRAPWQKRHLSVLERFQAEDAAKEKAEAVQRRRDETARRATLGRLEKAESMWNRCKRSIRCSSDETWLEIHIKHGSLISGGETAEMTKDGKIDDEDRWKVNNIFEDWEGDYTNVLAEYEIL